MAELCKKCFIDFFHPSQYDIDHIVMSKDNDFCEGCMNCGPYVDHIGTDEEVARMNKPKLIMMVGLPCSGKSTYSQELAKKYDATVFSSDALRAELFGDINEQSRNNELFVELHKRIKNCLASGKSAIYDACNHHYKERMVFLQQLNKIPCEKICVVMATPYEECIRRSSERERHVPEYVIERMYRSFDPPYWYEGWNDIQIEFSNGSCKSRSFLDWMSTVSYFNQDNSHHTLTLGQHSEKALDYIFENVRDIDDHSIALRGAGALHDNGKCFTKTFKNSKGEITDQAHYYNHEHVGSYDVLFYNMACNILDVAVMIRWHMQPYYWEKDNNEKLHNKYRKLWGEKLYQDIMKLHEADKAAH